LKNLINDLYTPTGHLLEKLIIYLMCYYTKIVPRNYLMILRNWFLSGMKFSTLTPHFAHGLVKKNQGQASILDS